MRGIGENTAQALISMHGSLDAVVAAARHPNATGALVKVRGALDYIQRASRVVRITDEAPVGAVDTTIGPADPTASATAELLGLGGAMARLRAAIDGLRT